MSDENKYHQIMSDENKVSVSFSFDPDKMTPKRRQKAYEAIGAVCAALMTKKEIRKLMSQVKKKQREIAIMREAS